MNEIEGMRPLIIRDSRVTSHFFIDNEFVDRYASTFGPYVSAVYLGLARHANNRTQACFPSQRLLSKKLRISERKVRDAIKILEKYDLIAVRKRKIGESKYHNNEYVLRDKSQWRPPAHGAADLKKEKTLKYQRRYPKKRTELDDEIDEFFSSYDEHKRRSMPA